MRPSISTTSHLDVEKALPISPDEISRYNQFDFGFPATPTPPSPIHISPIMASNHTDDIESKDAPPPYTPYPRATESVLPSPIGPTPAFPPQAARSYTRFIPATWRAVRAEDLPTSGLSKGERRRRQLERNAMLREKYGCLAPAMSRKWICYLLLILIALIIIIAGAIVGSKKQEGDIVAEPDTLGKVTGASPALPIGTVVVQPFRQAQVLTACTATPKIWSCTPPPGASLTTIAAENDGAKVPEFKFVFKDKRAAQGQPMSAWTPFPDAALVKDYQNSAAVDKVIVDPKEGEETDFLISLAGTTKDAASGNGGMVQDDAAVIPAMMRNQPLRLFNRGQDTEHWGFQVYFDKTAYFTGENTTIKEAKKEDATTMVAWKGTRFSVKIYTKTLGKQISGSGVTDAKAKKTKGDIPEILNLPVEIWEDGIAGSETMKAMMVYEVGKDGQIKGGQQVKEPSRGNLAAERGCWCRWSNFGDS
jgi:hypothetical protein